jgi:hypothetical protein
MGIAGTIPPRVEFVRPCSRASARPLAAVGRRGEARLPLWTNNERELQRLAHYRNARSASAVSDVALGRVPTGRRIPETRRTGAPTRLPAAGPTSEECHNPGRGAAPDHQRPCDGDHSADLVLPAALPGARKAHLTRSRSLSAIAERFSDVQPRQNPSSRAHRAYMRPENRVRARPSPNLRTAALAGLSSPPSTLKGPRFPPAGDSRKEDVAGSSPAVGSLVSGRAPRVAAQSRVPVLLQPVRLPGLDRHLADRHADPAARARGFRLSWVPQELTGTTLRRRSRRCAQRPRPAARASANTMRSAPSSAAWPVIASAAPSPT